MLPRNPSSFTPFPDGRSLLLGPDKALTHREIAKFSSQGRRGAARSTRRCWSAWPTFLEPTLMQTPPNPWSVRPGNLLQLAKLGLALPASSGTRRAEGGRDPDRRRPRPILDRWFESEQLKVTLATDAIIGAMAVAVDAGDRLRAVPPRHGRVQRRARRVGLRARRHGRHHATRIAAAARETGAEIRTERRGRRGSWSRTGAATGRRAGGRRPSSAPAGWRRGVDANVTFLKLMDSGDLPADFVEAVAPHRLRERDAARSTSR